jgi:hypothetical protein
MHNIKVQTELRLHYLSISLSLCDAKGKHLCTRLKGRAHTTGENGEWGETKHRSENQVAFNSVLWGSPNNIKTVSFNFVCS